jgi:hypothetical protein
VGLLEHGASGLSPDDGVWASLADEDRLERLKAALEESLVIVEHRFYFGSRAPHVFVVDDFHNLRQYAGTL